MKTLLYVLLCIFLCCAAGYAQVQYPEAIPNSSFHSQDAGFAHGRVSFVTIGGKYRADFNITNDTSEPIDFTNAQYSALAVDGSEHKLKFGEVNYNSGSLNRNIAIGGDTIGIYCYSPVSPDKTKLKEIQVRLKDNRQIRFVPD
ncbi:MAG: hypothetical protein A2166_06760 [Omnitrophica WOR_2 bacterium RBG_13_41_10]|nr:MAG: hypothetical protein A2166_06760 [Omnitrophica WOR_2 bacterium RBG_13_41_10]